MIINTSWFICCYMYVFCSGFLVACPLGILGFLRAELTRSTCVRVTEMMIAVAASSWLARPRGTN